MTRARTVAEVIAGEAVSGSYDQRMTDMRAIASVIANRAQMLGISPEDVVANTNEFNAYNRSLPPGVGQNIIDMAQQAIDDVEANGPVHNATFYATPAAVDNLPSNLSYETATSGHQYFSDPLGRAIGTANGYVQPNQYAYAANLSNVPTPSSPTTGLLSGWNDMASAAPVEVEPGHPGWGLNQDVAPSLSPTVEGWSQMASASPIEAPSQGLLASSPSLNNFGDLAAAGPFGGQYASVADRMGLPSQPSQISQADISRAFFNPTAAAIDPSFTAGLMSPSNAVVPSAVETKSYSPSTAVAAQPADLGGFASAMSAQREVAPAGLFSDNHQQVQQLADQALANALKDQQQITPSAVTAYSPTAVEQAPAVAAINGQMATPSLSPSQIAGYQQMAEVAPAGGIMNLAGQSIIGPTGLLSAPAEVQAPALDTVEVADQPTVAGPATTPAIEQQQAATPSVTSNITAPASVQTQQTAPTQTFGQRITNAINPGTIGGGILGGLTAGPIGGVLGSLLGNSAYNGSMSGLFSNDFSAPTNQIGGGMANIASIYGGQQAPGTYSVASNGATITAQPGGYTSYENKYGVRETIGPDGKIASDWGGFFSGDDTEDSESEADGGRTSGGLFGGWF